MAEKRETTLAERDAFGRCHATSLEVGVPTVVAENIGGNSLDADGRHAYDAVQVGTDPVDEAPRQILGSVHEIGPTGDRERSNLCGHHEQLVLFHTAQRKNACGQATGRAGPSWISYFENGGVLH